MKDEKWLKDRIKDIENLTDTLIETINTTSELLHNAREEKKQYELMLQ